MVKTLFWSNGRLCILDQRLLPRTIRYISCRSHRDVAKAIREMAIRGAPAIGVAAAFGIVLASREKKFRTPEELSRHLSRAAGVLAATRPTAVNLFWALSRMKTAADARGTCVGDTLRRLKKEAGALYEQDIAANRAIGRHGAALLKKNTAVLTHCNAGALATAGYGTALGVIRAAFQRRRIRMVYVDETRPYLQGARLTAWELEQENVPFVLITDNMAGHFMKAGDIDAVIVGADRIAANGDTANKIGTYSLAVLARHHRIPFYVAAPTSTIDFTVADGGGIVIEERSPAEVLFIHNKPIAPEKAVARHPAFDVTPARYIAAIITEKGIFRPRDLGRLRTDIALRQARRA